MMKARFVLIGAVCAVLVCISSLQATVVDIVTVPVGNAGNTADSRYGGYGAVGYEYNIGQHEVTAGQYTEFLNKVAGVDAYGLYNTTMSRTDYGSGITRSGGGTVVNPYTYSVNAAFVNRPVNYVSWGDSARFANWLHNDQPTGAQDANTTEDGAYALNGATSNAALLAVDREADWKWALTSEDEWYKAAYYNPGSSSYYDYPTSNNAVPGRDMADVSGNNANYYTGSGPFPIDSPYYTTVAGEFQNSDSPYGTFDQGGNVWEWNESVLYGSCRGLRGGSFYGTGDFLLASIRNSGFPADEDNGIGFRVSEVPEPCSILMLALGSLGIFRRRRA